MNASAQKVYKFTKEQYQKQARTTLIIGGVLVVGGTIGTLTYEPSSSGEPFELQLNPWPVAIVGGTIVSLFGIDKLIKSKRIAPTVAIQQIPGLEHMGIKYGKLPSLGIKYSF